MIICATCNSFRAAQHFAIILDLRLRTAPNFYWPILCHMMCFHYIVTGPCYHNPCQNGGTCRQTGASNYYTCTCTAYYTGNNCQTPLPPNPCNSGTPCHGGTCRPSADYRSFTCLCGPGWTGTYCTTPVIGKQAKVSRFNFLQLGKYCTQLLLSLHADDLVCPTH